MKYKKAPSGYLTTFDFARLTGIPYTTLYYYVITNQIKHIRIYGRIFVSEKEIERIRKMYYEPINNQTINNQNKERENVSKN